MFSLRKNHPSSHPTIWTISPHPIPTHTIFQQLSPTRLNFDALQYKGIRDKMEKSKLDAIQQKLHDLKKKVNDGLNPKPAHDLRYEKLCLHPRVELPSGFKIPRFNMFDGRGDNPIAHLKDFYSGLVGLENNEPLLMRLFIQSLSGISFIWYVKQDFDKWLTWEDMARDFVEQYKFNMRNDPTMLNLLKIRKLSHESFEEYVIRWRIEASKISHLPNEEELVQTLIRSLDGIYYKTLYFASIQSFDSLIRIGKELEYGIQSGRIIDEQIHFQVLKNSSDKRSKNVSTIPLKPSNQNTKQVHAIFDSCDMRFKPYNPRVFLHKVRKPRVFTPLMETLTSIFQRLWAKGLLKPREGSSALQYDIRLVRLTIRHWVRSPCNRTSGSFALQYNSQARLPYNKTFRFVHLIIGHQARLPYNRTFRLVCLTIGLSGSSALQYDIQARPSYNTTFRLSRLTIGHLSLSSGSWL
ncbi:hypothetical protein H5410_028402 [Solanum commersonii]|uniref:Retrotransposon gag domain-containing protein n=1 Tax=Solanum commersonii TaxID=4109 RepID=A0A9J5Z7E2_SOLCO|nr:hypothetical protein H5410_028402 [Solanum commersonii]